MVGWVGLDDRGVGWLGLDDGMGWDRWDGAIVR